MSLFQQAVDPYYIYITKLASSAHFMHKEYRPHKESNFTGRVKVKSSNGKNVGGDERLYPLLSFCFLMNAAGRLIKVSGMNFLFLCKLSGARSNESACHYHNCWGTCITVPVGGLMNTE